MAARPLPGWHNSYQAALFELDREKVPNRIELARKSLVERLRELDTHSTDQRGEVDRILNALRMLELLNHTLAPAA